jgi:hypothetical protein
MLFSYFRYEWFSTDIDFSSYKKQHQITVDKSLYYLVDTGAPDYAHKVLDWDLKKNVLNESELPAYEYVKFGKLFASMLQEELAFQCFYMSHLKDHKNYKTNSELQFETYNSKIIENNSSV